MYVVLCGEVVCFMPCSLVNNDARYVCVVCLVLVISVYNVSFFPLYVVYACDVACFVYVVPYGVAYFVYMNMRVEGMIFIVYS